MNQPDRSGLISLAEALTRIPRATGGHAATILQRGSLDVKIAVAPQVPPTLLTPHEQDELYLIVRGNGVLFHDGRRDRFEAGDLMFVAAGVEHRFEDYSEDLTVWVVFHGPRGGEIPYLP